MKELLHVLPPPSAPIAREWRHYTLLVQHGRYTGGGGIYINRVRECDKMHENSSGCIINLTSIFLRICGDFLWQGDVDYIGRQWWRRRTWG